MKVLILSQVFFPDVVAVSQHLTDLAAALAAEGHQVRVLCARSRYDAAEIQYPANEVVRGAFVRRLWSSRCGKATLPRRVLSAAAFFAALAAALATGPRPDVILCATVPPLLPSLAALYARCCRRRFVYWCADLNPDQAFALGTLDPNALLGRCLDWVACRGLLAADSVIAMDPAMAARLVRKGVPPARIHVIPPWAHEDEVHWIPREQNPFLDQHQLRNRFVIMYAGNHSPCHSLQTLLDVALRLRARSDLVFCFVGGGSGKAAVRQFQQHHQLENILDLPYQPLNQLSAALSAADLHVVSLGDPFVGIVHPCKIYNILALNAPFLYFGPAGGPIQALADDPRTSGLAVRHGDLDAALAAIEGCAAAGHRRSQAAALLQEQFAPVRLLGMTAALVLGKSVPTPNETA